MAIQFHETVMGHRFFEQQLPQLLKAVNRLAAAMEEANKISEAKDAEAKEKAEKAAEAAAMANSIVPIMAVVTKALTVYPVENVDVVVNDEGFLEVIWHNSKNSFPIEPGVVAADEVNLNALAKTLDALGVGHCF